MLQLTAFCKEVSTAPSGLNDLYGLFLWQLLRKASFAKKKARLHLSFGPFLSFGEGCIWCSKCEFLQLFLDHFKMEKLTISVIFYWGERGNLYKNWLISSSLMTFKGQIISKCSFVILQFSQKTDKRIRRRSRNEFVRSFFGRIRGDQKSFRNYLTFSLCCKVDKGLIFILSVCM